MIVKNLKMSNYGTFREYTGIYVLMKNKSMHRFIYLTIIAKDGYDFTGEPMNGVHMYVNYRYEAEPKKITISKDFHEFMEMDKETFFTKLDVVKEIIEADTKDEPDAWTRERYIFDQELKDGFWKYLVESRREIVEDEKRYIPKVA